MKKLGFCDFSKLLLYNTEINVNERMINMENNVLAKSVFTFTVENKVPKKVHSATDCIDCISKDYNNTFEELIKNVKYFKAQSSGHGTIIQIPYTYEDYKNGIKLYFGLNVFQANSESKNLDVTTAYLFRSDGEYISEVIDFNLPQSRSEYGESYSYTIELSAI